MIPVKLYGGPERVIWSLGKERSRLGLEPYGSLPELVSADVGYLSNIEDELVSAIQNSGSHARQKYHEYAGDLFNSKVMTSEYLKRYEKVLRGEKLNERPHNL